MKWIFLFASFTLMPMAFGWGFFGHRHINYHSVFLLPPEMILLFKTHINFLTEHSVDPDKRRYAVKGEAPRHYLDIDRYGPNPRIDLPHQWAKAVEKYSEDSLNAHGIVPWWIQTMLHRLTNAFRTKNLTAILKNAAEIGHYIGDLHVPLHASSNHNGQHTGQHGIHGFWESRVPELLADQEWDFFIPRAEYLKDPLGYTWDRLYESAAAADTVLKVERLLSEQFAADRKFAFEERNGVVTRQYSTAFTRSYNRMLNGMVERRMRQSMFSVASFWYTAWVNAGKPDLSTLSGGSFSPEELQELEELNAQWKGGAINEMCLDTFRLGKSP